MIEVLSADTLEALPPEAARVWEAGAAAGLFQSRIWAELVCAHAMPAGSTPHFLFARGAGAGCGLLPLRTLGNGRAEGLHAPYTCRFAPILLPPVAAPARALARALRRFASVRLEALDPDAAEVVALATAARAAGLVVLRFDHFGTWYENVAGQGWAEYLQARPGPLRSTIRRKFARMARDSGTFALFADPDGIERGIRAYEDVYRRSWKEPEPFPTFNPALVRRLSPLGSIRLGVYLQGGRALAAQIWLVEQRRATVLKLAHDEAARDASPGTVLTALMLRHLLDNEHVAEIDFGRGDDPYKRLWAGQRRQMVGMVLANPWRVGGMAAWGRHAAGRLLRFARGSPAGPRTT